MSTYNMLWYLLFALAVIATAWFWPANSPDKSADTKMDASELYGSVSNQNKNQADDQTASAVNSAINLPGLEPITNKNSTNNNKQRTIMSATFHTNKGDIKMEFNPSTPNTVQNFLKLADSGFYNGVKFHRVIKGFMIQGGDPLTKDDSKSSMWGTGGPGYAFADEITENNNNAVGTISMANSGPNTNGSQFFINVNDNSFLNGKHTVFGRVIEGMDIVKAIEESPTGAGDRPISPIVIESVSLQ